MTSLPPIGFTGRRDFDMACERPPAASRLSPYIRGRVTAANRQGVADDDFLIADVLHVVHDTVILSLRPNRLAHDLSGDGVEKSE